MRIACCLFSDPPVLTFVFQSSIFCPCFMPHESFTETFTESVWLCVFPRYGRMCVLL